MGSRVVKCHSMSSEHTTTMKLESNGIADGETKETKLIVEPEEERRQGKLKR